ncbi:hypothetical protein [Frankia sp. Cr2]|uniref:hypothetical protein n=1 Tax=Frankia sp. Cr2 TaxID=3073932 RepID=UPI002AD41F5D|nr:hypothetical protein [Frankia sp. Cr2]
MTDAYAEQLRRRLADLARAVEVSDDIACADLGRAYLAHLALRVKTAGTLARLAMNETPGPEVSVDKVLLATAEQTVLDAGRRIHLPSFSFGASTGAQVLRSDWFYTRAASIYGGSAEVQRSILADHVLRLPREAKA